MIFLEDMGRDGSTSDALERRMLEVFLKFQEDFLDLVNDGKPIKADDVQIKADGTEIKGKKK